MRHLLLVLFGLLMWVVAPIASAETPLNLGSADQMGSGSGQILLARNSKKKTKKKTTKKKTAKKSKSKKKKKKASKWSLSLSGGLNVASAAGDETNNLDTAIAFNGELGAIYTFTPFVQLETGLGYSAKGYTSEQVTSIATGTQTYTRDDTFGYLSVPIMARVIYPKLKLKPFLRGGLYVGVLVNSEREDRIEVEEVGSTSTNSVTQEIPGAESVDVGVRIGVGAEIRLTRKVRAMVAIDYLRGFLDPVDETAKPDKGVTAPGQAEPAETAARAHGSQPRAPGRADQRRRGHPLLSPFQPLQSSDGISQ